MSPEIALAMIGLLIVLILSGVHISIALGTTSVLGIYLLFGAWDIGLAVLGQASYDAIRNPIFAVIPLFVLMGDFVSKSGTARDLYRLCNRALRRLPGRLAVATVAGNAVFAAVTGVSIASAAAFSRIAYPQMVQLGYRRTFALGVVAGSACLGMLIPPSILLIVWAILTEMSVGALFIAGVLPGVLLALLFAGYCTLAAWHNPDLAPMRAPSVGAAGIDDESADADAPEPGELVGGLGIVFLIVLVIGGIWYGFVTPIEAAGFGTLGALVLGLIKGMRGSQSRSGKMLSPMNRL